LVRRFVGTPLEGNLRAKTGTLTGATGLVGFESVTRPLAFAFVANGNLSQSGGIALRERVATILSRYPDSPPADELVPTPATP
jgi:serine-type D-Ala-D-Ala carboxypeptidase/endopeptidase (penicillin-binding protein 4)